MGTFHPSTTVVAAAREIMHPKGLPAAAPVDEEEDARELYAILIYISAFKYLFTDIEYIGGTDIAMRGSMISR